MLRYEEYLNLVEQLNEANNMYYNQSTSIMSDYDFDMKYKSIEQFERVNPHLKSPVSPTTYLGAKSTGKIKVKHEVPMLSLENTYNEDDIKEFLLYCSRSLGISKLMYSIEPKFDGVSLSLIYENGVLTRAVTRGDGVEGDDVTHLIRGIVGIIPILPITYNKIIIRGEVVIPWEKFYDTNKYQRSIGKAEFKHPRNLASGSLNVKDVNDIIHRGLTFIMYDLVDPDKVIRESDREYLFSTFLRNSIIQYRTVSVDIDDPYSFNHLLQGILNIKMERDRGYPIPLDGAVIKLENITYRNILGATNKYPRWAVAFKFPTETQFTKLESIRWGVGRTGKLTPVAEFEPVILDNTEVKQATLNNYNWIRERDIRIGDVIEITKAAEIIPYVVKSDPLVRTGNEIEVVKPVNCPCCGTKLVEDGADLMCTNVACLDQVKAKIALFVSRDAMNIHGLGDAIIDKLVEEGIVKDPIDLFYLNDRFDTIVKKGIVSEKVLNKILKNIEESKSKSSMTSFLAGLSIPFVGKIASKLLTKAYNSITSLLGANKSDLVSIDGIGDAAADAVINFFNKPDNQELIRRAKEAGIKLDIDKETIVDNSAIINRTFCITGSFEDYSRQDLEKIIILRSGKVTSSVSKNTDVLICGENAGSKLDKARELNVDIWDESKLREMLNLDRT